MRYEVSGTSSDGQSWSGVRRCRVQDEVRLKTVSGEHDTYKVVCYDPWTIRIWHVSPKLGESVHQIRYRKRSNELTKWEMTD